MADGPVTFRYHLNYLRPRTHYAREILNRRETHQIFSVHTTLEKFTDVAFTGQFEFSVSGILGQGNDAMTVTSPFSAESSVFQNVFRQH